jgi:anti-sigma factor RsiW
VNCARAEKWLSRMIDGELAPGRTRRLERHLEHCPACRERREQWQRTAFLLRGRPIPAAPPFAVAWAEVRQALGDAPGRAAAAPVSIFGSRLVWAAVTLAMVMLGLTVLWRGRFPAGAVARPGAVPGAVVEWVETELPGATPMVYQDPETGCTVIWIVTADDPANGRPG